VSAPRKSSLADTHPEIAAQADGWDSSDVATFSNKKLNWKCDHGHQWTATIASRSNGIGCPICSNQQVLTGYNDLATTYPDIAKEADGWDPTTVTAGSNKKLFWRCLENHAWDAPPHKRVGGAGCPVCSGNKVLAGFNDLVTTHPEIAKQADGWDPRIISKGSNKKLRWKCVRNHVWTATTNNRTSGLGCPICSNQQVLSGYNDLATTHPELAAQADGWDPTAVSHGHKSKKAWRCDLGHKWDASVSGRTGKNSGCPICSNQQVLSGYNDLATINPSLASQADGWDPQKVTPNARKSVSWQCEHGHKWKAAIYSRASGVGCPACSITGFNPNKKGWLYLVLNDTLDLLQIGISNDPETRLEKHRKNGFETVLDIRGPMKGSHAKDLETAILESLLQRNAVFANKSDYSNFDGWTESWTRKSIDVQTILELLGMVYSDEEEVTTRSQTTQTE